MSSPAAYPRDHADVLAERLDLGPLHPTPDFPNTGAGFLRLARRFRHPGRLPVDDRAALRAVVYVLCKGVSWRDVPTGQLGCNGVMAWRRLRGWTEAGSGPGSTKSSWAKCGPPAAGRSRSASTRRVC
ncbi:transposase [Streptomyces goshikiensis]|uniref:transposase n=1 Tax=Streptomyces goshikiensis TaxID=1942 RepID=UPI003D9DD09C